jgi:hypothetical protein
LRQQEAVGRDHKNLRAGCGYARLRVRITQSFGLKDSQTAGHGELLDRALRRAQAAPGGAVRLCEHQGYLVARLKQRGERALCECRGAREDEAQERT